MATSEMTLKLVIDTRNDKVLFAEAGKDFIDFLFALFALPLGTVTCLLDTKSMVGCLGDLYESVQHLGKTYIHEGKSIDSVLKPTINIGETPLLLPKAESVSPTPKIYACPSMSCRKYAGDYPNAICPVCNRQMTLQMINVPVVANNTNNRVGGGFVKGVVTYMVTDNLEVTPMSGISSITLLKKFNIKDLSTLEERTVNCGKTEGLNLLKASLQTKSVLTSIFLQKKETRECQKEEKGSIMRRIVVYVSVFVSRIILIKLFRLKKLQEELKHTQKETLGNAENQATTACI